MRVAQLRTLVEVGHNPEVVDYNPVGAAHNPVEVDHNLVEVDHNLVEVDHNPEVVVRSPEEVDHNLELGVVDHNPVEQAEDSKPEAQMCHHHLLLML